jgi:undecaprenyl-diphosphatase
VSILKVILLGLTQGATEFLPVSSSGHLFLVHRFLEIPKDTTSYINIFMHLGTLLAVVIYYRKTLFKYLNTLAKVVSNNKNIRDEEHIKKMYLLIVASIPISILGILFDSFVEKIYDESNSFETILLVSFSFVITGIIYLFSPYFYPKKKVKLKHLSFRKAIFIGAGQSLALLYGVSRSGLSILSSRLAGLTKQEAVDFSFLLSIIAIGGGVFWKIITDYTNLTKRIDFNLAMLGILTSFISGYISIQFLIKFLKKHTLKSFAFYMILVGILTLFIL